jgi:hypothetical protein
MHIHERDAFYPPMRLFIYRIQSIFSRINGVVDGSAQARAILKSPTSSFKWKQKIVSQTLKTLSVNAFISWRMLQMKGKLETK